MTSCCLSAIAVPIEHLNIIYTDKTIIFLELMIISKNSIFLIGLKLISFILLHIQETEEYRVHSHR